MDALEIISEVKGNSEAPRGWVVLPLVRSKVMWGIIGWIFGIVLGMGLFAGMVSIVIPSNYQHGVAPALFTSLLLALLLFIGLGSLWALFVDVRRLQHADEHMIVITPNEFLKQERENIIHVPLMYVRNVTARGAPPIDRNAAAERASRPTPNAGENLVGFFAGRGFTSSGMGWRRKRMRTPTSLAFIDSRTDSEVTVVTDGAYGDPFMIAALLKQYAASVQSMV